MKSSQINVIAVLSMMLFGLVLLPKTLPAAGQTPSPSPTTQPQATTDTQRRTAPSSEALAAFITTATATQSLTIPATAQWLNTSLRVQAGDRITITATGAWTPGPPQVGMVGPAGATRWWQDNFLNLTDIGVCAFCATTPTPHWAALIGYIGEAPPGPGSYVSARVLSEAQRIFVVGSDFVTRTVWSGTLWLNINDDAYSNVTSDNAGAMSGNIQVTPDYDCTAALSTLSTLGQAVWNVVGEQPFCENQYEGLTIIPTGDPASGKIAFEDFARRIGEARYEVNFATMSWHDEKDKDDDSLEENGDQGPGVLLLRGVKMLYDQVQANPIDYPQGMRVRILLGLQRYSLTGFGDQRQYVLQALERLGVPLLIPHISGKWK